VNEVPPVGVTATCTSCAALSEKLYTTSRPLVIAALEQLGDASVLRLLLLARINEPLALAEPEVKVSGAAVAQLSLAGGLEGGASTIDTSVSTALVTTQASTKRNRSPAGRP